MNKITTCKSVGRRPKARGAEVDTRGDVLSAARCVFAQRGFNGTSVREVAEVAGVNKAMIYYHFKDKNDLYRAVLSDAFDALQRVWEHKVFKSDVSARKKIKAYVDEFIRFQHHNEDIRKIMTMEYSTLGEKSENIQWIAKQYFAKDHATLVIILKQGMKTGEIKKTDPLMAVVVLIGMIIHSFLFVPMSPYIHNRKIKISVSKLGSFVTGMFFDGIGVPGYTHPQLRGRRV